VSVTVSPTAQSASGAQDAASVLAEYGETTMGISTSGSAGHEADASTHASCQGQGETSASRLPEASRAHGAHTSLKDTIACSAEEERADHAESEWSSEAYLQRVVTLLQEAADAAHVPCPALLILTTDNLNTGVHGTRTLMCAACAWGIEVSEVCHMG
jgi:hypothetical protein